MNANKARYISTPDIIGMTLGMLSSWWGVCSRRASAQQSMLTTAEPTNEPTMKVMRHESLGIYVYAKPKNQRERDYNDRMREKAEALRCHRYESIVNERYDFFDKEKMRGDFLAYFKQKADKKNSKWQHVYKHFARFCNTKCRFDEINVDLCNKLKDYLMTAPQTLHQKHKLHINSVAGYWSTFLDFR